MGSYDSDVQSRRARKRWKDPHPDRFWSRVRITIAGECWLWMGALSANGYGVARLQNGKQTSAHRVAYFIETGRLPEVVRHTCDNPRCVNPEHLRGGTQADNMQDMILKGRQAKDLNHPSQRGEQNHNARITSAIAAEIREAVALGFTQRELAKTYGVSKSTIWAVVHRKNWNTHAPALMAGFARGEV